MRRSRHRSPPSRGRCARRGTWRPAGPFAPTWASLETYEAPDWYEDGKFGIFIHWGVYSVPAFGNEWYPRTCTSAARRSSRTTWRRRARRPTSATRTSSRCSRRRSSTRSEWAALFKAAGARYVVPVAEHHDGFPMYDCSFTEWSAAKMGPKRDVIGELARRGAGRGDGLRPVDSHRAEHWWFFDQGCYFDSDVGDPRYAGLYGPARSREKAEDQRAAGPGVPRRLVGPHRGARRPVPAAARRGSATRTRDQVVNIDMTIATYCCSCIPEVVEDAALLVNPNSEAEITSGLETLLHDSQRRNLLIEKGRSRCQAFSWSKSVKKTVGVYESVVVNANAISNRKVPVARGLAALQPAPFLAQPGRIPPAVSIKRSA